MSENLFSKINEALDTIAHGWTTPEQAQMLASAVLTIRPEVTVEIGVYAGKGLVSLGLAHREIGRGMAIGIDPYSQVASAEGQLNPADAKFWGGLDHEMIYAAAQENIRKFGVQNCCRIERCKSDQFHPPDNIGVLRIDGNHGETVLQDVQRYCPKVIVGGILFLDDLGWTGGSVLRAAAQLRMGGWRELCAMSGGLVFQKIK